MSNFLLVHGVHGHPLENWFPWLKDRLEELGHTVVVPEFPTPEHQTLKSWNTIYQFHKSKLGEEPILVGHSLGGAFILRLLEERKAKAAVFVAPVSGPLDNEFDASMSTFSHPSFNYEKIKEHCPKMVVFHSDNDKHIPTSDSEKLAEHIDAEFVLMRGAGHFGAREGCKVFPELLEKIKTLDSE